MAFTTESTTLPIIRLRLTEGKVCADPSEYMATPNRSLYRLLNTDHYGTCKNSVANSTFDPRYSGIASISEDILFKDNDLLYTLESLPDYPMQDMSNYTWNLFVDTYNYWNPSCGQKSQIITNE
jgi:hypothetical protein